MFKRTDEKLHKLEVMAMEIAKSITVQARDRIEAMRFLRSIYEDELSLFWFGPSHFLVKDALKDVQSGNAHNIAQSYAAHKIEGNELKAQMFKKYGIDEDRDDPSNTMF